jgi:hypothetical protein
MFIVVILSRNYAFCIDGDVNLSQIHTCCEILGSHSGIIINKFINKECLCCSLGGFIMHNTFESGSLLHALYF